MPAHKKHATKSSIAKLPSKKLCMSASPPSPPRLDLPPLLKKTWEFVRNAEEAEGRTLAPLTGSALEAQLLIHRIESSCIVDASPVPMLERQLSIIEDLPNPLPDVTEQEWSAFRQSVMPVKAPKTEK